MVRRRRNEKFSFWGSKGSFISVSEGVTWLQVEGLIHMTKPYYDGLDIRRFVSGAKEMSTGYTRVFDSGDETMQGMPLPLAPDSARRRKATGLPIRGADVCLVCVRVCTRVEIDCAAPRRHVAFLALGAAYADAMGGILH